MEDLLKEATKTIEEVQEAAPLPVAEPEGGVPWGGIGIGVLAIAVIAIATKILSD